MMDILSSVYEHAPLALQELMVTTRGWQSARYRYGSVFRSALDVCLSAQWRTEDEWDLLQRKALLALVEGSRRNVPYYATRLPVLEDVADLTETLEQIPLLEKETLRSRSRELQHRRIQELRTFAFRTSGTTGTPLVLYHTVESQAVLWAAMERFWRWAGVRRGDRRLSFTGNRVVPRASSTGPFGRRDRANCRMLMSVYHLGTGTVDTYLDEIERFKPAFIDGYPSAIVYCARRAIESGREIAVQACFPTAETLSSEDRAIIEKGFHTRVYNQYGATEGAALIAECPAGSLHVCPDVGIVEVLQPDGRPAPPGEIGELVLTGLTNRAMPLIRYRIGDLARAAPAGVACPCGRAMPVVAEIIGRQDDTVVTSDGRRIGMLSYNVFKWVTGIAASQIVQEDLDHYTLRIVPDTDFENSVVETAIRALRERVGEDVRVDVEICDAIPRTSNGKLRAVISRVNRVGVVSDSAV